LQGGGYSGHLDTVGGSQNGYPQGCGGHKQREHQQRVVKHGHEVSP